MGLLPRRSAPELHVQERKCAFNDHPTPVSTGDSIAKGQCSVGAHSFPKAARLLKRSDFIILAEAGKKIQNNHFILVYQPSNLCRSRIGITVSRRVGNAVGRNRLKRLAREYFRLHRHELNGFWDINIIAKKGAAELANKEVYGSLAQIFARIHPVC